MQNHFNIAYPKVTDNELLPLNNQMIEAIVRKGNTKGKKLSAAIYDTIITNFRDDEIVAASYKFKYAKIELLLRLNPGLYHMCITHEDLDKGRVNGMLCRCI